MEELIFLDSSLNEDVRAVNPKWRLGLDLGTNSIGWAVLELDDSPTPEATGIIDMGVRIFSTGREPKTGQSLAVSRRQARVQRRNLDRKKRRHNKVLNLLIASKLLPENKSELRDLQNINPLKLRNKGLDSQLPLHELGRAIYHLGQRRGFKSTRKENVEDTGSNMKEAISKLNESLKNYRTVGEYLYKTHYNKEDKETGLVKSTRFKPQSTGTKQNWEIFVTRQMIEEEFRTLWKSQAAYYPEILTSELEKQIFNALFYQRPLRPAQHGNCVYYRNEERTSSSLVTNQLIRILDRLNNLRLKDLNTNQQRTLSEAERNKLVAFVFISQNTGLDKLRKHLFSKQADDFLFTIESERRNELFKNKLANLNSLLLENHDIFDSKIPLTINQSICSELDEIVKYLEETDDDIDSITAILVGKYGYSQSTAEALAKIVIPTTGYEKFGTTASKIFLQYLLKPKIATDGTTEWLNYTTAEKFSKENGDLKYAIRESTIYDYLPYYGEILNEYVAPIHIPYGYSREDYKNPKKSKSLPNTNPEELEWGKIGNPTVHSALNQLRKVVNLLIKQYGKPAEIVVEVARELKLSAEERKKIESQQTANQKENEELDREISVEGASPNRENRDRLRLFKELQKAFDGIALDVYSGQVISMSNLFGDNIQIEHILPYSRTLDNSLANKTLATVQSNLDKGNRAPYEAFGAEIDSKYDWDAIQARISSLPNNKKWRFSDTAMEKFNDEKSFIARQLTDTAYISKVAKQYLEVLFNEQEKTPVRVVAGRLTSMLRHSWGLNNVLNKNENIKNRSDHRHHAVDALVIGLTTQSMIQKVAKYESVKRGYAKENISQFPEPWTTLFKDAETQAEKIIVSHKQDYSVSGQLHQESAYGVVEHDKNKTILRKFVYKEEIQELKDKDGNLLLDKKGQPRTKKIKLKDGYKEEPAANPYIKHHVHNVNGEKVVGSEYAYTLGSNYAYELFIDEKKSKPDKPVWSGEIISTMQANSNEYKKFMSSKEYKAKTFSGKELVLRLRAGDVLESTINKNVVYFKVVQFSQQSSGGSMIGLLNIKVAEAYNDVSSGVNSKDNKEAGLWKQVNVNTIKDLSPKLARINEIGQISYDK